MKVALLSDWYLPRLGGLEMHLYDLSRELTARGCDVHIVTPNPAAPRGRSSRDSVEPVPIPGVTVHRLPVPLLPLPHYRLVYTRGAFAEISSVLGHARIDLLHCMVSIVSPAAVGAVGVGQRLGIPTVATFHSMLTGFRPVLAGLDRLSGWSRWPVLSAVSEAVAAEVRPLVPGRTVHVLPNGVDPSSWGTTPAPRDPAELRIVSVMRLNRRKRGSALLRAIARARTQLSGRVRIRLTVVGDGPQRARLHALTKRLGLEKTVRFIGHVSRERVRDELSRADVFALASSLESFGIAALEARAAGVPVVALDRGGMKEFLRHERDALLVPDDRTLSDGLVRLARDELLLARLRAGAAETPVPCSWEQSAQRHLEVYEEALGWRAAKPVERATPNVTAAHPAPPMAAR